MKSVLFAVAVLVTLIAVADVSFLHGFVAAILAAI